MEGPIAGANPMMMPIIPMALPRLSRGNMSRMSENTVGMRMPVALAWQMRPKNRNANVGAQAHRAEPAANSAMPPTNSLRVGKRPSR